MSELTPESGPPLLTVACTSYNHASTIDQTMEGFAIQKTRFPFEIVVHDDASTDETQLKLQAWQRRLGARVRLILQPKNVWINTGVSATVTELWPSIRSRYIAWCEGDDFWVDPLKLQKQVDALEAHPESVICFHRVKLMDQTGALFEDRITNVPEDYSKLESYLLKGNYIHTPSVVFRNVLKEYPPQLAVSPIGDFFLFALLAQHGKLLKLEDVMAVYRCSGGTFSGRPRSEQLWTWIRSLELMHSCVDSRLRDILRSRILEARLQLVQAELQGCSSEDWKRVIPARIAAAALMEAVRRRARAVFRRSPPS